MCCRPTLSQNVDCDSKLYEMIAGLSSQEFEVEVKENYDDNLMGEGDILYLKEHDKNLVLTD